MNHYNGFPSFYAYAYTKLYAFFKLYGRLTEVDTMGLSSSSGTELPELIQRTATWLNNAYEKTNSHCIPGEILHLTFEPGFIRLVRLNEVTRDDMMLVWPARATLEKLGEQDFLDLDRAYIEAWLVFANLYRPDDEPAIETMKGSEEVFLSTSLIGGHRLYFTVGMGQSQTGVLIPSHTEFNGDPRGYFDFLATEVGKSLKQATKEREQGETPAKQPDWAFTSDDAGSVGQVLDEASRALAELDLALQKTDPSATGTDDEPAPGE